ncbi:DUF885 domain-containing protein [Ruania alba]|uniref:Uncharacterized conserved protein, DUF885 familyt n=1 Tax=Ruania alba TaxID=648782 RepID=A0A1H5LXZ6_9MICO|nr:DUF885 domain-containing protein [Ruania alba]SEE81929.1 Uncharacterized conserved protein, DUF885 familyt [Ruania alba]
MNTRHEAVRAIADDYVRARAADDPEAAAALGQTPELVIADLSPDGFARRHATDVEALRRLTALVTEAPETADDPLAAALTERLRSDIALDEVGFTRRLLAPLATPVHQVRQAFDDLPRSSEDDWQRVARHLEHVPTAYAQFRETLTAQAASGNIVAVRQVRTVAEQCRRWVDQGYYPGVVAGYEGGGATAARLASGAERAVEATASFAQYLETELAPAAPVTDAVGRDTYTCTSQAFLGASVDLDELYDFGWELIDELRGRARALATEIVGTPDVAAAVAALDADTDGRVAVGDELQGWLQGRIDETMSAIDGVLVDVPARTRPVEAMLTTAASGVMYYTPPDAQLTRPGRVWWTVPEGTESVATWHEVSTVHHEGVPGHHLQHAVTYAMDDLHPWQRLLCHVHGYAEGWAHYAEELAGELGLLRTPGEELGMVFARLWRACRIVIDIGLHLQLPIPVGAPGLPDGAREWTPELGAQMLTEVAQVDPVTAGFEVDRYLGWPGQALAFAVGARLWRQTRQSVQARTGAAFDLREFHTAALRLGPMGLGPLRAALTRTFTEEQS